MIFEVFDCNISQCSLSFGKNFSDLSLSLYVHLRDVAAFHGVEENDTFLWVKRKCVGEDVHVI